MRALAIVAIIALSGCTPATEQWANACNSLGFTNGTPDFAHCMLSQQQLDQQRAESAMAALAAAAAIQAAAHPYRPASTCVWQGPFLQCF